MFWGLWKYKGRRCYPPPERSYYTSMPAFRSYIEDIKKFDKNQCFVFDSLSMTYVKSHESCRVQLADIVAGFGRQVDREH